MKFSDLVLLSVNKSCFQPSYMRLWWHKSPTYDILWGRVWKHVYHMTYLISYLTIKSFNHNEYQWQWWTVLQWRHNERNGVSNHRRLDCLLNCLLRRRSKKTIKLRVTGHYEGNPPVTGGLPSHKVSVTRKMSPFDDVIINSNAVASGDHSYTKPDVVNWTTLGKIHQWDFNQNAKSCSEKST